ncbi:glycoside hydrolase family 13 protein [Mycobacterium sp.]|uniref:glycoside hydrolase family 13 protein n=1 Tax=Mycobacterium sp. TaxID=1785 RepID=UPI002B80765F|nr:glycoside hydrolase family 13 protein [Mycobacterium sp.]HKP40101.1 glycoside hydrolase family 13 protein [Mycobacterium sp.]
MGEYRTGPWWSNAVFYQVYPRSICDSNSDGVGDLDGATAKLPYLRRLGADAIWLNPVYVSPMADEGYDITDPRDVDPLFGGIQALDRFLAAAHELDLRVVMDLVPNHSGAQHPWFQAALAADHSSAQRERYIFRDGRGPDGMHPPNNWVSVFGGPAWTRVTEPDGTPGQWYMHLFAAEQPDLNWDNPEVIADFEQTMRFWLDRGVDGFRIDVAHAIAKPQGLPDMDLSNVQLLRLHDDDIRANNHGVHVVHRRIRALLDEYEGAVSIGEVWVDDFEQFGMYVRPDELHLSFNFQLLQAPFEANAVREAIRISLEAVTLVGATPTWALANHDVDRTVQRYGGGKTGLERARAMALVMLALPGAVFVYYGEELGLPNVVLPDEALRDPVWERSGREVRGRDGCRIPMPWEGSAPPFGFSDNPDTWLPMPAEWTTLTVETQEDDPESTLSLFRKAIELRHCRADFNDASVEFLDGAPDLVTFRCSDGLVCALNAGRRAMALPVGEVLLASAALVDGQLPPNTAAWLV